MKVIPSFSAVCLDLPSIHLIVRLNLVLSVMWSMLSTNSLHCLLLWSDVDSRGQAGFCSPSCPGSVRGLVAYIAYVFQWGYDGKQHSIVSLGTTSRLSGNQLEDDGSTACVISLACIRSSQPS